MNYQLTIGWLYPELMSTYGDRGNITVLQKRCEWRGIKATILPITEKTTDKELQCIDLLFGGGSQDREQEIVMRHLKKQGQKIKDLVERDIPALFVCGAPQLMGKYYEPALGKKIEGLGIFNMITRHPGPDQPRLIGNVVAQIQWDVIANEVKQSHADLRQPMRLPRHFVPRNDVVVGFENHGGRTYLGEGVKPFAKVLKGFGNNGEDGTEGVVYKNAIGCYLHGPLLPKNPEIADFLLQKALEVKYKTKVTLSSLDDTLELKAKSAIAQRLGIEL